MNTGCPPASPPPTAAGSRGAGECDGDLARSAPALLATWALALLALAGRRLAPPVRRVADAILGGLLLSLVLQLPVAFCLDARFAAVGVVLTH